MTETVGVLLIAGTGLAVALVAFYVARTVIRDITEAYDGMLERRTAFTDKLIEENKRLRAQLSELKAKEYATLNNEVLYD